VKNVYSTRAEDCFRMFAFYLKGQSHEKVYEFLTWDGSFSLN
jgi:hypothetical protein